MGVLSLLGVLAQFLNPTAFPFMVPKMRVLGIAIALNRTLNMDSWLAFGTLSKILVYRVLMGNI